MVKNLKKYRSFEPGKMFRTRSFFGVNWDFRRCFESESKISHYYEKYYSLADPTPHV